MVAVVVAVDKSVSVEYAVAVIVRVLLTPEMVKYENEVAVVVKVLL